MGHKIARKELYLQPDQQIVDFVGLIGETAELLHHGEKEVGVQHKVDKCNAEGDCDQNQALASHVALRSAQHSATSFSQQRTSHCQRLPRICQATAVFILLDPKASITVVEHCYSLYYSLYL